MRYKFKELNTAALGKTREFKAYQIRKGPKPVPANAAIKKLMQIGDTCDPWKKELTAGIDKRAPVIPAKLETLLSFFS